MMKQLVFTIVSLFFHCFAFARFPMQTESGAIKAKHWMLYSLSEGLEQYPN